MLQLGLTLRNLIGAPYLGREFEFANAVLTL